MTQKDLNEIYDLVEDMRTTFKKLEYAADPYTRMERTPHRILIERTVDCVDVITRYLVMLTAQREGWEPGHPSDELKTKLNWCLQLTGRSD